MPTAARSRFTVELDAGADPIRGSIERPDGGRQPFWGWLELIEELRRIAGTPAAGNSHRDEAGGSVAAATGRRKKARKCDTS